LPNVVRARLNCYAAENLILSDDVLASLGTSWPELQSKISEWLQNTADHPKRSKMLLFAKTFDRRNFKVKDLEVTFLHLIGRSKPWEVAVGQAIAEIGPASDRNEGSLADFLGVKIIDSLKLCE
jgi:hypothetical protein